jgi:hypothetical protein
MRMCTTSTGPPFSKASSFPSAAVSSTPTWATPRPSAPNSRYATSRRSCPGLIVSANLGGEHAYITSTINAQTAGRGPGRALHAGVHGSAPGGLRLADHLDLNGFIRGDYEYTGKSFGSFQTSSPQYINPAYDVVNMNAGVGLRQVRSLVVCQESVRRPHHPAIAADQLHHPGLFAATADPRRVVPGQVLMTATSRWP